MHPMERTIAYFSMEIALRNEISTYSGGLGVLAGDTVRSAADLRVPLVAVSLLHRKGYFRQTLDAQGRQVESEIAWPVAEYMTPVADRVLVELEGRTVIIGAWRFDVPGVGGASVPVYLLDADLPANAPEDRRLTDHLYGGDPRYRLCQEAILGIGGVRMLRALGYHGIKKFHLNEGHSALLTLELLKEALGDGHAEISPEHIEAVREQCVFTTHTPVPTAMDHFPAALVEQVLGANSILRVKHPPEIIWWEGGLNMTYLALNLSRYVNGVAKRHGEVSRLLFPHYAIDAITNGVHAATWTARPFQELFDRYVPGWREDNFSLRYALSIPHFEAWNAHREAKSDLLGLVRERTGIELDPEVLTLGFARRATTYKRADFLFRDLERLRGIAAGAGGVQAVFAGKAHPHDEPGKEMIQRVHAAMRELAPQIRICYLPDYDCDVARRMVAGVDVWLNVPQRPLEASGTSGMKAALNGVPSLSVLDGWWIEGCIEGVTGWALGGRASGLDEPIDPQRELSSLYKKLEQVILPLFYGQREDFIDVMLHAIALNGSFFNTQRMVQQYVLKAYFA